ncbi:DUF3624 domain-containing protein [Psychromonas sp. MME2]|uniref:DUF3624 domain-containing protein n=1 Tax=unclassified Psychromonas TaxID=2614957 RepID=UPI00339C4F56
MSCSGCNNHFFKEKLGRCRSCMLLNFVLLLSSAIGWYFCYQSSPSQVTTIALLFALIGSGVLMVLHLSAYLYYQLMGQD